MFKEYDAVRIVSLIDSDREFHGSDGVARAPQVGDTGIIVAMSGKRGEGTYVVESVDPDGMTVWLADFHEGELALAGEAFKENDYIPATPKTPLYLLGALLGSLVAFFIVSYWLGLAPAWLALLCGAPAALLGVLMMENIGEAIMMTLIVFVLAVIFITNITGFTLLKAIVISLACGLAVGKLVVGVWKESAD